LPLSGSSALNMLIVRQVKHETHGSRPVLLVFFFRFFIHFSFHFLIFHVALFGLCARPYSDCDATAAEVAASAFSDILSDLLPILPWVKLVSYGLLRSPSSAPRRCAAGNATAYAFRPVSSGFQIFQHEHFIDFITARTVEPPTELSSHVLRCLLSLDSPIFARVSTWL